MKWTLEDIAYKMDTEGGLDGFLRWGGLTKEEVPEAIYREYMLAEQAHRDFVKAEDELKAKLPDPWYD